MPGRTVSDPVAASEGLANSARTRLERRSLVIAALAGLNLSLVQFVSLTELPSLVGSNELVALIVLTAWFLGMSCGYLVSDLLSRRALTVIGCLTLALHLTLPFSMRWLAGTMWRINLEGNIPPFLFFLVLFGIAPFYAVFLPRLIDAQTTPANASDPAQVDAPENRRSRLVRLYATELAGAGLGLLLVVVLTPARIRFILMAHLLGLIALLVLWSARRPRLWLALLGPLPLVYGLAFPVLDHASLAYFYQHRRGFDEVEILASELSPYQRVDIFRARWEDAPRTYLYLNGNLFYGTSSLNRHNLMVSILPNLMVPHRSNALVIAGGSLDAARYLAPRVAHLRVVELDETVARLSREHIQEPRGDFPTNWELVIDDGKHFLGSYDGAKFDVISIDVPMPTHLQTAMLHSQRFFALAKTQLAPGGIFSISLSGSLDVTPDDDEDGLQSDLSARVMAGLLASFSRVVVVKANGGDFAWASDAPPPIDPGVIDARLRAFLDEVGDGDAFGKPKLRVLDDATVRAAVGGALPIGEADMQIVLRASVRKLVRRFYEPAGR